MRTHKVCTLCGTEKPVDQFKRALGRLRKDGTRQNSYWTPWCRKCKSKKQAEWRLRNPEKARLQARRLNWRRLGISISQDQYLDMLQSQHGVCAICKLPCATGKSLAVDHDHVTGKVRALLCSGCNQGIGSFKDSPPLLIAAAEYCIAHGR